MIALHPAWVMNKIAPFYVADLHPMDIENSEISKDFRELNTKLHDIGKFTFSAVFDLKLTRFTI